jgi:L-2-hydroxyglutarate oxidase LhgO
MTIEKTESIEIGAYVIGFACARMGIEYKRYGKWIVTTASDQQDKLGQLFDEVRSNSVTDVHMVTREENFALEPQLSSNAALLSPLTGFVNSHALMLSVLGDEKSCIPVTKHIWALLDLTPCVAQ